MFIKKLSKKERVLGGIILALLLAAFCERIIVAPLGAYWRKLNREIESKSAALLRDRRLFEAKADLEKQYRDFSGIINKSTNQEEELAQVIAEIEAISKNASCRIVNLRPLAEKQRGAYQEMSFEIIAEGNIEAFMRFFYEIEKSDKYLYLKRFAINSRASTSGGLKGIFRIGKIIIR